METVLRLAIQKKGRLNEKTMEIINNCGIQFNTNTNLLKSRAYDFPLELIFLRDDDIAGYVADGVADIGIVGQNELEESQQIVDTIEPLGFARCRLSIAVPNNMEYNSIKDLEGKRIATSYPHLLQRHLNAEGVNADIHTISGSVEIAPAIGLSDAICDLVSTGSTLLSNGLRETEVIFNSEAVMVGDPKMSDAKKVILDRLLVRMRAVKRAKKNKYILLNAPESAVEKIITILPGMKSPSVVKLAEPGWVSMHSVVAESDFWEVIEKLREAGAQGILVVPIEKMIY